MAVYEVFSHPLKIRYKANLCSKTTIFYFVIQLLNFILPILFVYHEGYWRSVTYLREQPDISFKHKMLLVLDTKDLDSVLFWSTYKNLNELIPVKMQRSIPTIEHREEDYNQDGKYDELSMNIKIPLQKEEVVSIKMLLIFDYKLHLNSRLQMECIAYISHSSSLPGFFMALNSDLNLVQKIPLNYKERNTKYNVSVINETARDASNLKLEHILFEYAQRNVSTALVNQYVVWKPGYRDNKFFTINLNIKYPEQNILYKVELWEQIKTLIIKYTIFFVIFSYIFYKIKFYVFRKQCVPSIVMSPIKHD